MLKKCLAFGSVLTLIILLDPTTTPAQPDFSKGKRGDRGDRGGFPGGPGGFRRSEGTPPGGFTPPGTPTAPGAPAPRFGGPPGAMPPGPGGPPSGGDRPSRGSDPEFGWRMLVGLTGSDGNTVDLSKIPPERRTFLKGMIERRGGVMYPESGVWTKNDYLAHHAKSEAARASFSASGGTPGGPPGAPPGSPGFDPNGFNRDRGQWQGGWDPNAYQGGWGQRPGEKKNAEEERPVAMRYGKLPKGLPDWFDENDTDKDGQVSLYEWRKAGKDTKEFTEMDLNRDGLVTADELLRFNRQKTIDTKLAAYEEGTRGPGDWGLGEKLDGGSSKSDSKGESRSRFGGKGGDRSSKGGWGDRGGDSKKGNPWMKRN